MKFIVMNDDWTITEHEIHYVSGTYKPPHVAGDRYTEHAVIPSPGSTSFETVIQGAPRGRKQTVMRLYFKTYADYVIFEDVYLLQKTGTLILPENYTFECVIYSLGEPDGYPFGIQVDAIFKEV